MDGTVRVDLWSRENAFKHLRKVFLWLGWGSGNAIGWLLSAGLCQTVVFNMCCLLMIALQPRARSSGATLLQFSLQVVVACDIVAVLIDQLSPASLY